jgi:DNA-binding FrmR family transcriptional regulator
VVLPERMGSMEQEGRPQGPEEEDRELLVRLRRLEGQIRGIQRMVANGRPCEEIVTQILAVRAAVDRVGLLLLSRQVESCLQEGPDSEEMESLRRALRHLTRLGGSPDV